ncbi:MAG: LysE family transporter [Proteobacteria bacterium]|nr:LysE family transporter [Pseudomonadota bacterium]
MNENDAVIALNGFLISIGLVVAIGPQNVYVLRKGLVGRHVLAVSSACFLSDSALIVLGAAGFGEMVALYPDLEAVMVILGAGFLFWYGWRSFREAADPPAITDRDISQAGGSAHGKGVAAAIAMALALTFLNPHTYVDTLVILGGMSTHHVGGARIAFVAGAIAGTAVWFYGLGFGAQFFGPAFKSQSAWRVLDVLVGLIMWAMGLMLLGREILEHQLV